MNEKASKTKLYNKKKKKIIKFQIKLKDSNGDKIRNFH